MPDYTKTCPTCRVEFTTFRSVSNPAPIYCSLQCRSIDKRGIKRVGGSPWLSARVREKNPRWKGGRMLNDLGYVKIRVGNRYVLEHRAVMEQMIGRPLRWEDVVHHVNHDRADNRPENLVLTNRERHIVDYHPEVRRFYGTHGRWAKKWDACRACGGTEQHHNARGYCMSCYSKRHKTGTL